MFSLWDDASRDAEAENRIRRSAMAESELDKGVFSFVALSKSASEYEHRKAMVGDRLQYIAEKTENSVEDVVKILDGRMAYVLEASRIAEGKGFVLIDPNGKKVGGPFSSRDIAERMKTKAEPGTKIVSMGKKDDDTPDFLKKEDSGDDSDGDGDDEDDKDSEDNGGDSEDKDENDEEKDKKESSLRYAMRMVRTALEDGVDPIEWVGDLPPSSAPNAVPSEHNEESDLPEGSAGGRIPEVPNHGLDHSGWMADKKESSVKRAMGPNMPGTGLGPGGAAGMPSDPGAPGTPMPNGPGPSPTSPMLQGDPNSLTGAPGGMQGNPTNPPGSGADPSNRATQGMNGMASLKRTISRYNPHLSPRRVDEVARKVASRYLQAN